jgi:hypothetical protein
MLPLLIDASILSPLYLSARRWTGVVSAGRSAEELLPRRDASPTVHIDIDIDRGRREGGEGKMSKA